MAKQIQKPILRKSASTFKMVIPQSVEAKIRHLCSVVHDVEWSGTLFYRPEGSMEDGSFKVTCIDLFVMDIGSSTYTEFNESPDILTYRVEHNLLEEGIQEGLIHSHNNMPTFFSVTDTNTLLEEGANNNHFVSLIVNNNGTYTAGVTRKVTTESKIESDIRYTENEYYDSYEGQRVNLKENAVREEFKTEDKNTQVVEWFEFDIERERVANNFEDIDLRLTEIRRNKFNTKKYIPTQTNSNSNFYKQKEPQNLTIPYSSALPYKDEKEHFNYFESDKISSKDASPLCLVETFDNSLIKALAAQLLTGSIIINEATFDVNKWVEKMDLIYEKRFGPLNESAHPNINKEVIRENSLRLEEWIENMCEFLVYTKDSALLERLNILVGEADFYDTADTAEVCAGDLCRYLDTLPKSYVKEMMIECLLKYLPDGVSGYIFSKK